MWSTRLRRRRNSAAQFPGSLKLRRRDGYRFRRASCVFLRQPPECAGSGSETAPGRERAPPHSFQSGSLKFGLMPLVVLVLFADAQRGLARGGARSFEGAGVEGVSDDLAIGGREREIDERFRITRQHRRKRGISGDTSLAQAADGGDTFGDGRAERFVEPPHIFAIGSDGEADAQLGAAGERA